MKHCLQQVAIVAVLYFTFNGSNAAGNWPQFRGLNSQGVADDATPPTEFGPDKRLLWKTQLPSGVSSPCIWGDKIFITGFDAERRHLETICLDARTEAILWRKDAPPQDMEKVHQTSSPANTSPATDGKRVYVHLEKEMGFDEAGRIKATTELMAK